MHAPDAKVARIAARQLEQEGVEDAGIRVRRITEVRCRLRPDDVRRKPERWLAGPP